MKKILVVFTVCFSGLVFGQDGVLMGPKLTAIDNSAELEIYSTSRGVLLPRVASVASIATPATGLLVYDISQNSYSFYDGAGWILLPVAKFSEIRDADNNTRVTTEKTADADKIQIEIDKGAGVIATSIIDSAGLNMPAVLPYNISGTRAGMTSATSVYLGPGAGGPSPNLAPSTASNVMVGTNAGAGVTTGTNNVALGYGTGAKNNFSNSVLVGCVAGAVNAGDNNVFVGASSGILNSTGSDNVFVGNTAGNTNTTGSSNVLIGHIAGTGLVTGSGNIVIGDGIPLSAAATDSLKIGKIITVGDKVTFNNAYSFPKTAGALNQTMVLDADKKTLKWVDSGVSDADKTVIGSAAGLYTFDIGSKSNSDIGTMQRQMFIVPLVASASANISQLMTWKKIAAPEVTQMALYDENFNLLSTTGAPTVPASPTTAFVSLSLIPSQNVFVGKTYYIGVRSDGAWTDYAGSTTVTGTYFYMDVNASCDPSDSPASTDQPFPTKFETGGTGFPAGFQRCSQTGPLPWVRAF